MSKRLQVLLDERELAELRSLAARHGMTVSEVAAVAAIEAAITADERLVSDAEVLLGRYRLSARDAVHVAVMRRHGIDTVITFDRGFDGYPGIRGRP